MELNHTQKVKMHQNYSTTPEAKYYSTKPIDTAIIVWNNHRDTVL